jgi:branched-chain amino acid transport system permease protein
VRALPIEVARDRRWRAIVMGAAAVLALAVCVLPFVMGESAVFFLATVLLFSVVAVSATVLIGWAGQMSIGQWALAGVGGVFGAKLVVGYGIDYWVAFVIAALAGGVVALILGLPALRLEGTALAVVTLGFAVASGSWLFEQSWFQGTGFLERPSYMTTVVYFFFALALLVLTVVAARAFGSTRIGRNMIAVRDNPAQAQAMGISVIKTKLTAFVFAGVVAAAAGFLWSTGIGLADSGVFGPIRSLSIVAAVVIGGLGSISGAIVGAFYFLGVPYFGSDISPYIGLLATGIGLLLLVTLLPGGLARVMFGARDLLARLVTGIDVRPKVVPVADEQLEGAERAIARKLKTKAGAR